MTPTRRDFLKTAGAVGAGIALGGASACAPDSQSDDSAASTTTPASKRLLILGGTGFIGPYQVRYALERGHTVTLFNRGRTNTHLFPGVERLVGDRNGQLAALAGRTWDAVIDNSRANPEWVRLSAEFLKDSVDRYFYVSSRSAYADTSRVPMTADAPTFTYETAGISRDAERLPYGLAKALSERVAQRIFVGRVNIVRPGLIIGPDDESDRFTYWPVRIQRGGEVVVTFLERLDRLVPATLVAFLGRLIGVRCNRDPTPSNQDSTRHRPAGEEEKHSDGCGEDHRGLTHRVVAAVRGQHGRHHVGHADLVLGFL